MAGTKKFLKSQTFQGDSLEKGVLMQGGGLVPDTLRQLRKSTPIEALENVSKSALTRITVDQLPKKLPDFKAPGATKDHLVTEYLTKFIVQGLASQKLSEDLLLPRKQDLAKFLGISVGTVQNAIRVIEDMGHVESKQRIGTVIRDASQASGLRMRKLTSKRDQAIVAVKKFIVDRRLKVGDTLPSAREIAEAIDSASNTTRLALEYLTNDGILHSRGTRGNTANWELKILPDLSNDPSVSAIASETLIDQLERDLKQLIAEKFSVKDKLPSHLELAETLKVSIKTVHDAMKRLAEQGVVKSKRGRYGTFINRMPDTQFFSGAANIFVSVDDPMFYNYEKVERHLKQLIQKKYKVGDKLPPMGDLAKELDVSSNTIRKALQSLSKEKLVSFSRGRYGGTFVTALPALKEGEKTFKWVSINPETIRSYRGHQAESGETSNV